MRKLNMNTFQKNRGGYDHQGDRCGDDHKLCWGGDNNPTHRCKDYHKGYNVQFHNETRMYRGGDHNPSHQGVLVYQPHKGGVHHQTSHGTDHHRSHQGGDQDSSFHDGQYNHHKKK